MTFTRTMGLLLAGSVLVSTPALAWEVPGCNAVWNDLGARGAVQHIAFMVKKDCPVMYRKGWLLNQKAPASGQEVEGCRDAWNGLRAKGALLHGRFLVTHNCPVIYRNGWR